MDLYLIRHGETVDNVAGLYAGVTDSALTNHGVEQTKRLGADFAKEGIIATHMFASPLSRAFKTAQAILEAQPPAEPAIEITKVPELIEQDFGHYEKKPFQARTVARKSGREAHRESHLNDPGFVDVESKEAMNDRADIFLDQHLLPLVGKKDTHSKAVVVVVSHGIILSHLWRRLLLKLPPRSVTVAPEVTAAKGSIVLQHLGGWSNTGYLELHLTEELEYARDESSLATTTPLHPPSSGDVTNMEETVSDVMKLHKHKLLIVSIDRQDHLVGLKRQRGGIGRSKYDEGQQKLDGFFKRQRKG